MTPTLEGSHLAQDPAVPTVEYKAAQPLEMRAETRVPVNHQFAEVTILCPGAPKTSARVIDISRSGIGLVLEHHLPEGTWLKLKIGEVVIFGNLRYCRGTRGGTTYRAGLVSDTVITNPQL